jgi:hypothetical protein
MTESSEMLPIYQAAANGKFEPALDFGLRRNIRIVRRVGRLQMIVCIRA